MLPRHILSIGLLVGAVLLYSPGLSGAFQLDDIENLKVLEALPADPTWQELLGFAYSRFSGTTRLLPQLTFVLQARAWPDSPRDFIAFNILLHLLNGVLVFFLARKLGEMSGCARAHRLGVLTAIIWLSSPIQVAGVLYIIQRINQIAALFLFLGAIIYLSGRERMNDAPLAGIVRMATGVIVCGGLAVLSKENGALLPLLLLSIEASLLARSPQPALLHLSRIVLLYMPLLALLVTLLWWNDDILAGYAKRDFSLVERLLTQPVVLVDYLRHILFPLGRGLGLIHDDFPIVRWPPGAAAIFAILAITGSVAAALFSRNWPVAAFAVLWFLAGHALEASWIPLELYFDHRNYVPLFGPAFALASLAVHGYERAGRAVKPAVAALVFGWLFIMAAVTHQQATLWGKPAALLEVWLNEHPNSPRANGAVAGMLAQQGFYDAARKRLEFLVYGQTEQGANAHPEYHGLWLQLVCNGLPSQPPLSEVKEAFATLRYSTVPVNGLSAVADRMETGTCERLKPQDMAALARVLLRNSAYASSRVRLQVLAGRFLELAGQPAEALVEVNAAFQTSGDPEIGFIRLRLLAALGRTADVARDLQALERRIHAGNLKYVRYSRNVETWRRYLAEVMRHE